MWWDFILVLIVWLVILLVKKVQQKPPENRIRTNSGNVEATVFGGDAVDNQSTKSGGNNEPGMSEGGMSKLLELVLNREEGHPFGLNIAGGLGSSPFMDNDQSIFISKVVPGGLAEVAGLESGDRVLNVNGTDFTNIEHKAAVDAIRQAGKRIVFRVERKVGAAAGPGPSGSGSLQSPESTSTAIHANSGRNSGASSKENLLVGQGDQGSGHVVPPNLPSPNLVFPCPKPYKGTSGTSTATSFDAMIPSEVKQPTAVVTVMIKQPDAISERVPDIFPPAPTDLGTVTETITKSTLTETVFTRVTHNEPVMVPLQTEVANYFLFFYLKLTKERFQISHIFLCRLSTL